MKIYIASSWKNENRVMELAKIMRDCGHNVDCFADGSTGRLSVKFPKDDTMDAITFLKDILVKKVFQVDKSKIDWADAVVMVLPCGNSSHLEAGYAVGKGKKLFILGPFLKGRFDVMYGFATVLCRNTEELLSCLS